ncbi:serine O-acetyltransferase [Methylobacterium sp. A54F]
MTLRTAPRPAPDALADETAAHGAMSQPAPQSQPATLQRTTWAVTRDALRADRAHWQRRCETRGGLTWVHRGYQAVWIYRLSRYAHERGWRGAAWFLWIANLWLTGADIVPSSRIAGGLFLPHPQGTIIAGAVGRDVVFGLNARIGGLYKAPDRDIGGGPGLPVVGDGAVLEAAVLVLGAVRIGDRAHVGPGCIVLKDVAADAVVEAQDGREDTPAAGRSRA